MPLLRWRYWSWLLSTRVDLLPIAYTDALERLQDNVEPFPYADVERIIEEELAVRVSKAFLELEEKPIAAASLGQVHRARLRDGRMVAVKVQRPGIREQVVKDLTILEEMAELMERFSETSRRYSLERSAVELRRAVLQELDYRLESANLTALADNLAADGAHYWVLAHVTPQFRIVEASRPAQLWLELGDLNRSELATLINGFGYLRARQITGGNLRFLQRITSQPLQHLLAFYRYRHLY